MIEEEEGVKKNLREVVVGFANVEKVIAQVPDLVESVAITVKIAESEDGEGEEDEAEHLSHSLPQASVSQANISSVSHLPLGQAVAACLLPKGGHRVVHRMEIFFVVIQMDRLVLMQPHCHFTVVVRRSPFETGDEHRDTDHFDRLGQEN